MIENYFQKIDCPEKAYWLGFLCADAGIEVGGTWGRCKIHLSRDIEYVLDRFLEDVEYQKNEKSYYTNDGNESVYVSICNTEFVRHLMDSGCVPEKTSELSFPDLDRNLSLAFFLGFFDGDGCGGSYRLKIKNREFLIELKNRVGVTGSVHETNKGLYAITIDVSVLREADDVYPNSFKVNRCSECEIVVSGRAEKCRTHAGQFLRPSREKIEWPKMSELIEMVLNSNFSEVGRKLGVSDNAIRNRMKARNIDPKELTGR